MGGGDEQALKNKKARRMICMRKDYDIASFRTIKKGFKKEILFRRDCYRSAVCNPASVAKTPKATVSIEIL